MSKAKARPSAADELANLDGPSADVYEALRVRLNGAKTLPELLAIVDDDFKRDVAQLPEVAQRALRDTFSVVREDVKHVVKMDALANKVVIITDPPEFPPPSPKFPDSNYCVIKGTVEASGEPFTCRSSAVRIVRHFEDSKLESYPQRLTFYQESHASMIARNAKAGTTAMWLVKKESAPRERTDGIPF